MRLGALVFTLITLSGCAHASRVGSATGARAPVPVYFALSPPFSYEVVREIDLSLSGDSAHIEELVAEAETRASGADAIVIRELRSDARLVTQQIWRTCTSTGPGGRPFQYSCPDVTQMLLVDSRLRAAAVRRRVAGIDLRWPLPAPLAVTGRALPASAQSPSDDLPSLDEVFDRQ